MGEKSATKLFIFFGVTPAFNCHNPRKPLWHKGKIFFRIKGYCHAAVIFLPAQ
jgi:hypothetical protein